MTSDQAGEEKHSDAALGMLDRALAELAVAHYVLSLFVNGASTLSARAVADVRALCDTHLHGRYELNVIDVFLDPELVTRRGVVASPTLIRDHPLPQRVLVGNLSNSERVLHALDIFPASATLSPDQA